MSAVARSRGGGAPIVVQIVAFLIASLILTQFVNLTIVLLAPPPTPPIYQLGEVAAAIQGRSLQTRLGRPLARSVGAAPTQPTLFRLSELAATWLERRGVSAAEPRWGSGALFIRRTLMTRRDLATLLNLPETKVRLWLPVPPPGGPPMGVGHMGERPPEPRQDQPHPSHDRAAPEPGGGVADHANTPLGRNRYFDPTQRPIVGNFVAAAELPSGEWVTVRSQADPFPNGWQWRIIVWFVGWLALFSLAGYLFARRMTAPIGAFARAAEQLGRDPQGPPLALSGPAELGVAARAFNEMQVRIKRYVNDRTAMVGAISHDLRTPLTRIRFKVEGADPGLRQSVLADVAQMEAMISAVLVFIKDANAPAQRERLDLLSLLECEVDGAALTGADVVMLEARPVIINADPLGLQRLFGNLIDNAVKYGGGARVKLETEGGEAVVTVTDEGPGLPREELERVFDPFYRAEPSRNRDSGGVGLGLAVARSIARAHGGDLLLEPRTKGLAAVVRLPLPPA